MPDTLNLTDAEVREAAATFFSDFEKVMRFHDQILAMVDYWGKNKRFDQGLSPIIERQNQLMFGLRNLYADTYELLTPPQRSLLYKWIVSATGELRSVKESLGFAVTGTIIVAGVIITLATATALVAWHREIGVQQQALANQAKLIPLVAEGKLPADVLQPYQPTTIARSITAIGQVALLIAAGYIAWKLYQQWQTK